MRNTGMSTKTTMAWPLAAAIAFAITACGGGEPAGEATADTGEPAPLAEAATAPAATVDAPASEADDPATAPAGDASAGSGADATDADTPGAGATVGGDGSQIVLSPLAAADIEGASLAGELACAFAATGERSPLLLAKGDVGSKDAARGVVKVGDYVEPVGAPGGYDAMLEGAKFSGQGKTATVAVTGPATGGGESPGRPATLTYDRADGAKRTFDGTWTCGP